MNQKKKVKTAKSVLLSYYLTTLPVYLLITVLLFFSVYNYPKLTLPIVLLLFTTFFFFIRIVFLKKINNVIEKDMNAKLYREVITSKGVASNLYTIAYAYKLEGNYQASVDISNQALSTKLSPRMTYFHITNLASIYFTLGDREKLSLVCDSFDKHLSADKNGDKIKKQYIIFNFYRHFLEERYDECLKYCDERENTPAFSSKLGKLSLINMRAVVLFASGDAEGAKALFEQIAILENMGISISAKKYLSAIEKGASEPDFPEILPNNTTALPNKDAQRRITSIILIVIGLILIFFVSITFNK